MIDAPSVAAVKSFLANEPRSLERVAETFAMRTLLLTVGFAILDDPKEAFKNGLLGSSIIEAYLLYFYSKYNQGEQNEQTIAHPNASGFRGGYSTAE
jgi:hypothetical protein